MFDPDQVRFLEAGSALILGTVTADGEPHASRGWGLDVVAPAEVELLVDADDERTVGHASAGGRIAITAGDVRTLRSMQLKGRVTAVTPAPADASERAARYVEAFFTDIVETDGTDRRVLDRLVPSTFARCRVVVEELYDQTPGPGAGARLTSTGGAG